jgi:putative transposase
MTLPRRCSLRLPEYDYAQTNLYFLTICTAKRQGFLGQIQQGEINLSEAGRIVAEEWLRTEVIRPYVGLDHFIVMPNHFHGILYLAGVQEGTARRAPTSEGFGKPASSSLPTIIRAFKAAVTNRIRLLEDFSGTAVWQRNYYEHVIRNEEALNRIREYILNNPHTWELDRENPDRQGEGEFYRWLGGLKSRPGK